MTTKNTTTKRAAGLGIPTADGMPRGRSHRAAAKPAPTGYENATAQDLRMAAAKGDEQAKREQTIRRDAARNARKANADAAKAQAALANATAPAAEPTPKPEPAVAPEVAAAVAAAAQKAQEAKDALHAGILERLRAGDAPYRISQETPGISARAIKKLADAAGIKTGSRGKGPKPGSPELAQLLADVKELEAKHGIGFGSIYVLVRRDRTK